MRRVLDRQLLSNCLHIHSQRTTFRLPYCLLALLARDSYRLVLVHVHGLGYLLAATRQ